MASHADTHMTDIRVIEKRVVQDEGLGVCVLVQVKGGFSWHWLTRLLIPNMWFLFHTVFAIDFLFGSIN